MPCCHANSTRRPLTFAPFPHTVGLSSLSRGIVMRCSATEAHNMNVRQKIVLTLDYTSAVRLLTLHPQKCWQAPPRDVMNASLRIRATTYTSPITRQLNSSSCTHQDETGDDAISLRLYMVQPRHKSTDRGQKQIHCPNRRKVDRILDVCSAPYNKKSTPVTESDLSSQFHNATRTS